MAQQMAREATASLTPGACLCETRCPARPVRARPPLHRLLGLQDTVTMTHVSSLTANSRTANHRARHLMPTADSSSSARCHGLTGSGRRRVVTPRNALSSLQTGMAPHLAVHGPATSGTKRCAAVHC